MSTSPSLVPWGTSDGVEDLPIGYISQPTLVAIVKASMPTASIADLAFKGCRQGCPDTRALQSVSGQKIRLHDPPAKARAR